MIQTYFSANKLKFTIKEILNILNFDAQEITELFYDEVQNISSQENLDSNELKKFKSKTLDQLREEALKDSATERTAKKTTINYRKRSKKVKLYALKRSNGKCESCNNPAPFKGKGGLPYLEVHHTTMLCNQGADDPYSVIAVCPNCHREAHYSEDKNKIQKRHKKIVSKIEPKP